MQNITAGHLRVLTYSHIYNFPASFEKNNDAPSPKSELRVASDVFWIRLCAMGDLGFAEAYMYGDVECDDLVSLFQMFLLNRENLSNLNSRVAYLFTLPQKLTSYRFLNTIGNSRSNISAHYDISNEMFAGFLSEDMTYSCAIFADLDGDMKSGVADRGEWSGGQGLKRIGTHPNPEAIASRSLSNGIELKDELYEGQLRKLNHIIRKAKILPGQRVLEIGSGWGSLAILLTQTIQGTTVDTITLSVQQHALAVQRIKAAGLEDRITVHLMDYRDMPDEWSGEDSIFFSSFSYTLLMAHQVHSTES
jgi:cyclopropane-fatty-acyl-phospholipid synthase